MRHDVIVVGGGISGLATAFWLRRERPGLDVVVLEADTAAGGLVCSSHDAGFTVDWGPNALVPGAPDTIALVDALGLAPGVLKASPAARRRYLVRRGALLALPDSPGALLGSRLLSPQGKLRALLEPFVTRGGAGAGDDAESVSEFMRRRFGREAAAALAELMVTGLVAGDPERLSASALFPRLAALERQHGSILSGFVAMQRAAARARRGHSDGSQRDGREGSREGRRSFSFSGGLGRLTEALAAELGPALRLGSPVTALRPGGAGYAVDVDGGREHLTAAEIVLATPAPVSAELLGAFAPEAADACRGTRYVAVAVAALGYDTGVLAKAPEGYGFLAPRAQGVRSLGVQFSSSIFPSQAPDGTVLVRAIAGGELDPDFLRLSDAEAVATIRRDLAVTLGITSEPMFARFRKIPAAIPQYDLGHTERLKRLERGLAPFAGLHLIGNGYRGVGVNDCLREARRCSRLAARGEHWRGRDGLALR